MTGSAEMFSEDWLSKEHNARFQEAIFRWLARSEDVKLETVDSAETDISEYVYLPDVHSLSEQLRSCLQVTRVVGRWTQ